MSAEIEQLVGIDVGASFHQACVVEGNRKRQMKVTSSLSDHQRFISSLKPSRCRVVMEATGIYYLDLALDLVEAGIEVMVVNPKQAHHFAKALGKRSSTDPISAGVLADFAARMPFNAWTPPPVRWYEFRSIARQINRLNGDLVTAKNRLHALEASRRSSRLIINDEKNGIRALERRIERMLEAAREMMQSDAKLQRMADHMVVAKGFRETTVIAILGELLMLPRTMNARQCSCHAGLDVRLKKSGTSVEAKPRLSKAGNAYLRAPLFMPMLSAIQHDPLTKAHYERLQARGKTKRQAIGALMRKYLTGFWAVVKNDEPFDTQKLFSLS